MTGKPEVEILTDTVGNGAGAVVESPPPPPPQAVSAARDRVDTKSICAVLFFIIYSDFTNKHIDPST
jgi:hypothetical protein